MIDREFQDIRTMKNNRRLEHMESGHIFQIDMRIRHQIKHRSLQGTLIMFEQLHRD